MKILIFVFTFAFGAAANAAGTKVLKSFSCEDGGRTVILFPRVDRLNHQSYDADGLTAAAPGWMLSKLVAAQQTVNHYQIDTEQDFAGLGNYRSIRIRINEPTGEGTIRLTDFKWNWPGLPQEFALSNCKSIRYEYAGIASGTGFTLGQP